MPLLPQEIPMTTLTDIPADKFLYFTQPG